MVVECGEMECGLVDRGGGGLIFQFKTDEEAFSRCHYLLLTP